MGSIKRIYSTLLVLQDQLTGSQTPQIEGSGRNCYSPFSTLREVSRSCIEDRRNLGKTESASEGSNGSSSACSSACCFSGLHLDVSSGGFLSLFYIILASSFYFQTSPCVAKDHHIGQEFSGVCCCAIWRSFNHVFIFSVH